VKYVREGKLAAGKDGKRVRGGMGEEVRPLCTHYPGPSGAGSAILRVGVHEYLPAPKTKMYN